MRQLVGTVTYRSARASKDHHCIFGLQTSSHHTAIARCKLRQDKRTRARQQARNIEKGDREREKKANAKEALERVDYLYVLSYAYMSESITVRLREWEPAFLRQAREFLFFPLLPREASKSVPIFDRGTGSKPERLRSGFLQADLSLIV